jgi:O-succinylhomoserine sulfhydrylase
MLGFIKSLETLASIDTLKNALKVAEFLEQHPNVNRVKYPSKIASHMKSPKKNERVVPVAFEIIGNEQA